MRACVCTGVCVLLPRVDEENFCRNLSYTVLGERYSCVLECRFTTEIGTQQWMHHDASQVRLASHRAPSGSGQHNKRGSSEWAPAILMERGPDDHVPNAAQRHSAGNGRGGLKIQRDAWIFSAIQQRRTVPTSSPFVHFSTLLCTRDARDGRLAGSRSLTPPERPSRVLGSDTEPTGHVRRREKLATNSGKRGSIRCVDRAGLLTRHESESVRHYKRQVCRISEFCCFPSAPVLPFDPLCST